MTLPRGLTAQPALELAAADVPAAVHADRAGELAGGEIHAGGVNRTTLDRHRGDPVGTRKEADMTATTPEPQPQPAVTPDEVNLGGEESFPASDPPAWMGSVASSTQARNAAVTPALPLPTRSGPRPAITTGIPHAQIDAATGPHLLADLLRRIFALPGVVEQPTAISTVPGTRAFWLAPEAPLAHPETLVVGRELGHVHPDGTLHLTLPPDLAREAIDAGWADPHPLTRQWGVDTYVLLFAPRDAGELDVIARLVAHAHAYVTGAVAAAPRL